MSGLLLVGALAAFLVGLTVLKLGERAQLRSTLVAYRLRFPRDLDEAAVTGFLDGVSGLLLPWWRRWLASPFVVLEVHATASGIEHFVIVPGSWRQAVENLLQASSPGVRYEAVPLPTASWLAGTEYGLSNHARPLRTDTAALSVKLLTSLHPLRGDERVVVQWVLTPAGPVAPARVAGPRDGRIVGDRSNVVPDAEAATALRRKQAAPLLLGVGRIGVGASSPSRRYHLLRQIEAGWHESRAPGVHLRRRFLFKAGVGRRIGSRTVPLAAWPGTYNTTELAGLVGWPVGVSAVPGLVLGGCRQLAASPLASRTGTVIADSTFPGDERPLALDVEARLRHLHVLGPTGTGRARCWSTWRCRT